MEFELPPLPYALDALEPAISAHALELHYEKHHRGYMTKLAAALEGKPEASRSLVEIVQSASGTLLNNAAQVWNHTFFWESMAPGGGGPPPEGRARELIDRDLGGYDNFRKTFIELGSAHFASGWLWLVVHRGRLRVVTTPNALSPIMTSTPPLLTADLWEHAYYVDHENRRDRFLEVFLDKLVDWERVASRLEGIPAGAGVEFDDTIVSR